MSVFHNNWLGCGWNQAWVPLGSSLLDGGSNFSFLYQLARFWLEPSLGSAWLRIALKRVVSQPVIAIDLVPALVPLGSALLDGGSHFTF